LEILITDWGVDWSFNLVTAIIFILPSNSNIECEFEYTKNLNRTKYLFAIY